jgi:hypothetical protein
VTTLAAAVSEFVAVAAIAKVAVKTAISAAVTTIKLFILKSSFLKIVFLNHSLYKQIKCQNSLQKRMLSVTY